MKAFHSFWSKPNRFRNGGEIVIPDYELLTLMLSALKWQQLNGPITMVTDSDGAAFFERAGLRALWSEPLDTSLDGMDASLDPALFWAAGKLESLRHTGAPCVMLDTDMILWKNVNARLSNSVVAAHRESLDPGVYPDPFAAFDLAAGYAFPPEWDFSLPAANTAFLYMPDQELLNCYIGAAFRFMRSLCGEYPDPTVTMCFAEQRLLPMCAQARGFAVQTLLDEENLDNQSFVTHLWGHKSELAASPEKQVEYCLGCVLRLLSDFPEWEGVLAQNGQTGKYLAGVRLAGYHESSQKGAVR